MKIRISHPVLRDFFSGLSSASGQLGQKYLANAEKLLLLIEAAKSYPFDFIVFRITGSRIAGKLQDEMISGGDLQDDLRVFTNYLSSRLELRTDEQPEKILTVPELAAQYGVSGKTIRRWRKRGLTGKIYVFEDGRKRLGFPESDVDGFFSRNRDHVSKSARFTRLNEQEKQKIIQMARESQRRLSGRDHEPVLREVAQATGRSRETIRSIIQKHDQRYSKDAVFNRPFGRIAAKDRSQIFKLYRQGTDSGQLMRRFNLSRSSIYRIINQQRAADLHGRLIQFIDSPEFRKPDAGKKILEYSETIMKILTKKLPFVLSRDEEGILFRRYNYLKFLVMQERDQIKNSHPSGRRLDRIERYLRQAEETKNFLVEANLPLVVSIAGRHLRGGTSPADLVSEGNVSLMRAVEKFDYTKGYRFSTYANLAIAKDFARKIPAEAGRPDRAGGDFTKLTQRISAQKIPDLAAVEQARLNLRQIIEQELDQRERYVVLNRFQLGEGVIPPKPKTLNEIGQAMGLSKERVRQIELQALQKLRHTLSPEQFDLLTG